MVESVGIASMPTGARMRFDHEPERLVRVCLTIGTSALPFEAIRDVLSLHSLRVTPRRRLPRLDSPSA